MADTKGMSVTTDENCEGNDVPQSVCDQCDAVFYIYWNRSETIECIEFCPFCGCAAKEDE